MSDPDPYVVIDVETTGLKAREECMLEIGMCIVNPLDLTITDHWSSIIVPSVFDSVDQLRESCTPFIQEMHDKNELWTDLRVGWNDVTYGPAAVQMQAVGWLTDMMLKYDFSRPPMMGNSVQLDREFVEIHMPTLFELFHYRNIDVSTIKEVCSRRNPALFAASPKEQADSVQPHRVILDCVETIQEFRFYHENLFVLPEVIA